MKGHQLFIPNKSLWMPNGDVEQPQYGIDMRTIEQAFNALPTVPAGTTFTFAAYTVHAPMTWSATGSTTPYRAKFTSVSTSKIISSTDGTGTPTTIPFTATKTGTGTIRFGFSLSSGGAGIYQMAWFSCHLNLNVTNTSSRPAAGFLDATIRADVPTTGALIWDTFYIPGDGGIWEATYDRTLVAAGKSRGPNFTSGQVNTVSLQRIHGYFVPRTWTTANTKQTSWTLSVGSTSAFNMTAMCLRWVLG